MTSTLKEAVKPGGVEHSDAYTAYRNRLLVRWCQEKNSRGWCEEFDGIMVRDMGYTAKEVHAARGQFDLHHETTVTFASPEEITPTRMRSLRDAMKRWIRDYFGTPLDAVSAETALVSEPQPEPTGLSALEQHKYDVLKAILAQSNGSAQLALLSALDYSADEIRQAQQGTNWIYTMNIKWHCASQITDLVYFDRSIRDQFGYASTGIRATGVETTNGTHRASQSEALAAVPFTMPTGDLPADLVEFRNKALSVFVQRTVTGEMDNVMQELNFTLADIEAKRNEGKIKHVYTVVLTSDRRSATTGRDYISRMRDASRSYLNTQRGESVEVTYQYNPDNAAA